MSEGSSSSIGTFPARVCARQAIILAGGLGTRLRSEVPGLPKPMAPVAGRPFLEILMERCVRQGVEGFVLSVGYMHESISRYFGHSFQGVPVQYSVEREPLGTGGGLLLARSLITEDGPFLVMNGDTYLDVKLTDLIACHSKERADMTIALVPRAEVGRFGGVVTGEDGWILEFDSPAACAVNGGVYVLSRHALDALPWLPGDRVSLEKDLLPALLKRGAKVLGVESAGKFLDIGIPEDYRSAAEFLAR